MEQLVEQIREFFPDFKMSLNDLKNPTFTFVRDFYSRALMELGVDSENVRKAQIEQLEHSQDIDLLPSLNLITAINRAFPFLTMNLFDMLQPSPKRNAILMSKVMNFMEFSEARVCALNDEIRKFQEAKDFENELLKIRELRDKEINESDAKLKSFHSEKKDLKEKIDSLENLTIDNRKQRNHVKEEIQRLNENFAILDKEIESYTHQINLIKNEIETLKTQIVLNPYEAKQELDAKMRYKNGVLDKKKELEDKLKHYKDLKEKMLEEKEMLEKVIPLARELQILRQAADMQAAASKTKKDIQEIHKTKEKHLKTVETNRIQFAAEESDLQGRLSVLEKEKDLNLNALEEKKSEYSSKSKDYKKLQRHLQEELNFVNKKILTLEEQYKEFRTTFDYVKKELMREMVEICNKATKEEIKKQMN